VLTCAADRDDAAVVTARAILVEEIVHAVR
jgi:hypothetical protein